MPESTCVFCRIARGELESAVVHEDDRTVAFRDVNPQAPVHLLVIPRRHVASLAELGADEGELAAHLLRTVVGVARAAGLEDGGYRVVANVGDHGGQTVDHLHFHVLGGRHLTWPPG
jgi:histidine triad (HIT) family protein